MAPSYSRETMSSTAYFLRNHTGRGPRASLRRSILALSVESRTWTSAYRRATSFVKCPSTTSGPSLSSMRRSGASLVAWSFALRRTKINSSDPPLTAVCATHPTPPFLALFHPPIELASLRPCGQRASPATPALIFADQGSGAGFAFLAGGAGQLITLMLLTSSNSTEVLPPI
jgi:hypothetical protein